jgi:hypothetical protein
MAANKQQVFNVKQSTRLEELFTRPAVIELQDFFNPNEKAFFLSLLLMQLSALETIKGWREGLASAQKMDAGPLAGCHACTCKCFYRFEVSELVGDPRIKFDFNSSINRTDTSASEAAGWFCRLLCERLLGQFDLDLSYCLAVHLIKDQQLSQDAQLVMLAKIRDFLIEQSSSPEKPEKNLCGKPPRTKRSVLKALPWASTPKVD